MKKFIFTSLIVSLAILFMAGCSKDGNPVDDDHEHGHAEAVGCVITSGGEQIAKYEKGAVTGQFSLKAGQKSLEMTIIFIAEDGDLFQPEEEGYTFQFEIADENIVGIEISESDRWNFKLDAKSTGTTTITFKIFHDDHADFVAQPITVMVAN